MITRTRILPLGCLALLLQTPLYAAPDLTATPIDAGTLLYVKPGLDFGGYDKLYIEDMRFAYAADSPFQNFDAQDLARIDRMARQSLKNAVGDRFRWVDQPGPGVLQLRAAITGIEAAKKSRNLLSFTPVGLVKQGIDSATGANISLRAATIEVELADGASGERLLTLTDPCAATDGGRPSSMDWADVERALGQWAQRFSQRLAGAAPTT